MENANHLNISNSLKKKFNKLIKEFNRRKMSNKNIISTKNKKNTFFDVLFEEHENLNSLIKSLF